MHILFALHDRLLHLLLEYIPLLEYILCVFMDVEVNEGLIWLVRNVLAPSDGDLDLASTARCARGGFGVDRFPAAHLVRMLLLLWTQGQKYTLYHVRIKIRAE